MSRKLNLASDVKVMFSEDGVVLFHLTKGLLYTANGAGAHILRAILADEHPAAIPAAFARSFGVSEAVASEHCALFIQDLESTGLVRLAGWPS